MKKKHNPPNIKWADILKGIFQNKKPVCPISLKLLDISYQGLAK